MNASTRVALALIALSWLAPRECLPAARAQPGAGGILAAKAAVAASVATAAATCGGWAQVASSGPAARYGFTAYDSNRAVCVLFGGFFDGAYRNDTWEWNGTAWNQRQGAGPSPRAYHAMAFDSVRNRIVLFGGTSSSSSPPVNGETWEWDGSTWTRINVPGPAPRFSAAMAYDSSRRVTVLFAGLDNDSAPLGDTWEWDGTTWSERPVAGPGPRCYHALAYDTTRGVTVLFGGDRSVTAPHPFADTWEWNGATWLQRSSGAGPSPRIWHAMAYDASRGVTVLCGGTADPLSSSLGDTWEWNGSSWAQRDVDPLPGRYLHALWFDARVRVPAVFGGARADGGFNGVFLGDTRELRVAPAIHAQPTGLNLYPGQTAAFMVSAAGPGTLVYRWRRDGANVGDDFRITGSATPALTINALQTADAGAYDCLVMNACGSTISAPARLAIGCPSVWLHATDTNSPPARMYHGMVFDSDRGVAVMFGGHNGSADLSDTWEWNGSVWSRRAVGGLSARRHVAMAYDGRRHRTVLQGGFDNGPAGITQEWDGVAWTAIPVTPPPDRWGAGMVYDSARGVCVLFGGYNNTGPLGDTWEYDGAAWSLRPIQGPPARDQMSMAYDSVRHVTVLFGGNTEAVPTGIVGDTWEYDGAAWSLRATAGPPARDLAPLVFDPYHGVCVLATGNTGVNAADTWEWDGTTWTRRVAAGPDARFGSAMIYDTWRGESVLFAGYVAGPSDDTWRFRAGPPAITRQPAALTVGAGGTATFSVEAAGVDALTYQWRRNGVDLANDPWIGGATTATLVIHPVRHAHAGSYDVVVAMPCGSTTSLPAILIVPCRVDLTGDGRVNVADFLAFLSLYAVANSRADFTGNGSVDVQDFLDFLTEYADGC